MPPQRLEAIMRFQRLFRQADGLHIAVKDKGVTP
jgi:hypothetical protein